jgi:heme-degrading monooxygenase HmoA
VVIRLFGGIRVRPGMEDRERQLAKKFSSAVETMPGFISRSTYPAAGGEEVGVVRFDSRESLDNWAREGEQLAAQAQGIRDLRVILGGGRRDVPRVHVEGRVHTDSDRTSLFS